MDVDERPDGHSESVRKEGSLLTLIPLAFGLGAAAGLLGAVFRLALQWADRFRGVVIDWAHGQEIFGFVVVVGATVAATECAFRLVRKLAPEAKGSGIPNVEAILRDELAPPPPILIPVKFFGGFLAMGAGLALGREGPTVQMGAGIGHLVATTFRRNQVDAKALLAAGAGAGLATAFGAPAAGAVFLLEELIRRFDSRTTSTTLCASGSAIAISRLLIGNQPDFQTGPVPYAAFGTMPLFILLGVLAGYLGTAHNLALLGALEAAERLGRWSFIDVRAATVGMIVGLFAWFSPGLVGGGDVLTQQALTGGIGMLAISYLFLIRFALGPLSYAAGTPGGLFAPLLVLGAQSGLAAGTLFSRFFPASGEPPVAYAIVGMAAFFTAVVRSPLTGIILVAEMTGCFTLFLPMLMACVAAMAVPTLMGNAPIYDSLRPPRHI